MNAQRFHARSVLGALLLAGLFPSGLVAQSLETVGTRALGMGGAFVAVADDASAIYWNPAGLATGALFSLWAEWSTATETPEAPDTGAADRTAAAVALAVPAAGVGYYRLRVSSLEPRPAGPADDRRQTVGSDQVALTSLITHNTAVSLVQTVVNGLHVGTTLRFVRGVAAADLTAAGERSKEDQLADLPDLVGRADNNFDLDLGVMAAVGSVRLGLVARNLTEPSFEAAPAGRVTLERQVRAGVAYLAGDALTVALDLDVTRTAGPAGDERHLAVGAEQRWPAQRLAVRAGVRADTVGAARPVVAGGVSFAPVPAVWIEGQVTGGSGEGARGWSLAARVGF